MRRYPTLLALAVGGACAIGLAAGTPSQAQGWGPAGPSGPSGPGSAAAGAAPMGMGMGRGLGMGSVDQHFIVMMIPHHNGAIAMADVALSRARRPEIRALAQAIKVSQTQENLQMRRWYRQWYGQDVPPWPPAAGWGWQGPMAGAGAGAGPGPMGMGMAMHGGTELTALRNAKDVDRAFLEQMIPHHQMGVMMASMAQANGQHPQLRQLEQAMVTVQSNEIRQMEQWYRRWYP